jgi:hypothetical protein
MAGALFNMLMSPKIQVRARGTEAHQFIVFRARVSVFRRVVRYCGTVFAGFLLQLHI